MFCPRCHRRYDAEHRFCPFDGGALSDGSRADLVRGRATQQMGIVLGGRYLIKGFIGKGAMARVYLAEDLQTQHAVAVKVLEISQIRSAQARERFLREARAAAMIGHPNIIEVFDVGERADGAPYLVLEFLYGESLGDWLRREKRMDADIALPVLRQVASGLAAAHEAGIIHRDLKPDNVFLVGEPGDPYAVKILDFGLAKLAEQSGLTQAGVAVGTIEYMAPEQCVSDAADARTDLYGLGVVMYRMFTGHLPFTDADDAILLAMQLGVQPPPPSTHLPRIDPDVEAVILKAMRKRPENRYASAVGLEADLARLAGEAGGELLARAPLHEPDEYEPQGVFARTAADFFRRKLGMAPGASRG